MADTLTKINELIENKKHFEKLIDDSSENKELLDIEKEELENHIKNEKDFLNNKASKEVYDNIKSLANDIYKKEININSTDSSDIISKDNDFDFLLFDLENNIYFNHKANFLPLNIADIDGRIESFDNKCIYLDKSYYSASKVFFGNRKEISADNKNYLAFENIINTVVRNNNINLTGLSEDEINKYQKFSKFCMIPESIDIFNKDIRELVNKLNIITIPKSIALSYCLIDELEVGDRYLVINYDGYKRIATELSVQEENGKKIIYRIGFHTDNSELNGDTDAYSFSYYNFCKEYLDYFRLSKNVNLTKEEIQNIINSGELLKVFNKKEKIKLYRENSFIYIYYDEECYKDCMEDFDFYGDLDIDNYKHVFHITNIENTYENDFYNSNDLYVGISIIHELLIENPDIVLWKEALPKLSLEVLQDGLFTKLNLIDDDKIGQNVNLSLDKPYEISSPGEFILPKGKDHYYLPLERKIFANDINSEKEAFFEDKSFPLKEDVKVKLTVTYNYLADNPITLQIRPVDVNQPFEVIENTWVDNHQIELYKGEENNHSEEVSLDYGVYERDLSRAFRILGGHLDDFANGILLDTDFTAPQIFNEPNHAHFKFFEDNFKRIRLFYNNVNYNNEEYINTYNNVKTTQFLSKVHSALYSEDNDLISKHDKKFYKICIVRDISNIIVSCWYHNKESNIVKNIYKYLVDNANDRELVNLSRNIVSKEDDIYGVFSIISKKIVSKLENNSKRNKDIRRNIYQSLSQNCWFNPEWRILFLNSPNGREAIDVIIDDIIEYLKAKSFKDNKLYRDLMELLVCITKLQVVDKSILNPNDLKTKELLKLIKYTYKDLNGPISAINLKSRLIISTSENNPTKYPIYIYMLILALSGDGQVNVMSYKDD